MITAFLVNMFIYMNVAFLSVLPNMNFTIPQGVTDTICGVVQSACYFLPVTLLLPILLFSFGLSTFKVVWAIVLRVKSFIPTMGD